MEEEIVKEPKIEISTWFLTIYAKDDKQFYELYDKAIQYIPDTAFNKKWYRSPRRTFRGSVWGYVNRYMIGLNNPTLAKIIENP